MKLLLGLLVLFISSHAMANNIIQNLLDENPTKTPREILEKAFKDSNDQIDLSLIGTPQANCVISYQNQSLQDVIITRFYSMKPGVPGKGPLFPGTPTIYKNGIRLITNVGGWQPDQDNLNYYFSAMNVNIENNQIITKMTNSWNPGVAIEILTVRRNGNIITFSNYTVLQADQGVSLEYGYCW